MATLEEQRQFGASSFHRLIEKLQNDPKFRSEKKLECERMLAFHEGRNCYGEKQYQRTLDIIKEIEEVDLNK